MNDIESAGLTGSDPDDNFAADLRLAWQDSLRAPADDAQQLVRQLGDRVRRFDRTIFWRNVVEYGACAIVLGRSAMEMAAADRWSATPLASIGVVLFIVAYLWRSHRSARAMDPMADAHSYQTALLDRIDGEIRLAASVRYWYVLPVWLILVALLVRKVSSGLAVVPSVAEFLIASALCGGVIWFHERRRLPRLRLERDDIASVVAQSEGV